MIHKLVLSVLVAVGFGTAVPAAGVSLPVVPRDIQVGNVDVGGLISVQARDRLQRLYGRPIELFYRDRTWSVAPARLGATAAIDEAIDRALHAKPGSRLPVDVVVRKDAMRRFLARLNRAIAKPAVDSKLVGLGNDLAPSFTEPRAGLRVDRAAMARILTRAVRSSYRDARLQVKTVAVPPKTTPDDYGSIVVIRRGSNRLYLYDGPSLVRTFTVATGQAQYPTPLGDWHIVVKERDPTWNPPDSDWAKDAEPIPPGPGNPLGTRWMGLDAAAVGIHGTPDAASLGYSASHGCIRMRIPDAAWVFDRVHVGTPVVILPA